MEKTSELLIYLMACSLQGTKPEEAQFANIDLAALLPFLQWCAWRWSRPMRFVVPRKPPG